MKKDSGKIAFLGVLSLLVAIATLIGAAVLAEINGGTFSAELPDNNYSDVNSSVPSKQEESLPQSSEDTSSEEDTPSDDLSSEEPTAPDIETGLYALGEDSIVISGGDAGFVEGNINFGGITMEFSGQTVDGVLVATGTDSLNNTIEITLTFGEGTITASSRPIIQYEGVTDYLKVSGTFVK